MTLKIIAKITIKQLKLKKKMTTLINKVFSTFKEPTRYLMVYNVTIEYWVNVKKCYSEIGTKKRNSHQ